MKSFNEILVNVTATDPDTAHHEVWASLDRSRGSERDFIFFPAGEGLVIVRGEHLPSNAVPVAPPSQGTRLGFTLAVRAVHRGPRRRWGERLIERGELEQWLTERLAGFELTHITDARSAGTRIKGSALRYWDITGEVRVSDEGRARETLLRGVGRSKAFGFGMMIVTPLGEAEAR